MEENEQKKGRLLTVAQFVKEYSWPPAGGLRYYIFHEKTNGFDKVIVRVGRRVLIDVDQLFIWARSGQKGA